MKTIINHALRAWLIILAPIRYFIRTFPCIGHVETPSRRLMLLRTSLFYALNA